MHQRNALWLKGWFKFILRSQPLTENRARGARYNSALRFTAQYPETIVVVVSSDRPVSVFRQGKEIANRYSSTLSSGCAIYPLPLYTWLKESQ
jgi:hypothetical protein